MTKWYENSGNNADTILSTRVRIARNIKDIPFASRISDNGRRQVIERVCRAAINSPLPLNYVDMEHTSQIAALSYMERHMVSPQFIADKSGRGLLHSDDDSVSIMINEEDHLRLQVLSAGFDTARAMQTARRLDDVFRTWFKGYGRGFIKRRHYSIRK
jgi:protein arginine kinase